MTLADPIDLAEQQHMVLSDVSWDFYEKLLREIGDRPTRVTFNNGVLEMMAPLPIHEFWKSRIARLIEFMAFELDFDLECFGSTTYKSKDLGKGLEPDECYYVRNPKAPVGKRKLDLKVDPPPDLAIEIDITRRSVARQPIYAALRVRELWRFDGKHIQVLELQRGKYEEIDRSLSFPFLPMKKFDSFVLRMGGERQNSVLRDFRKWLRTLNVD